MVLSDSTSRFLRARTVWPQWGSKVQSSLFGGKTNFFENVALRPWVPKVEFLTVLGQGFQTKKTASRYDEE